MTTSTSATMTPIVLSISPANVPELTGASIRDDSGGGDSGNSCSGQLDIIEDYTEKSFVVVGPEAMTKAWKSELGRLGGRWNANLKKPDGSKFGGWVFSKARRTEVEGVITMANSGAVPPPAPARDDDDAPPRLRSARGRGAGGGAGSSATRARLEVVSAPTLPPVDSNHQIIMWKVIRPCVGMSVAIVAGGGASTNTARYTVSATGKSAAATAAGNGDVVDTVTLAPGELKLHIVDGVWQVKGMDNGHKIKFTMELE